MSLTKATYSMIDGAPANVTDFGAVGDGVADDTAAIQAAVDSMTEGGQIFFPPGKYKLTDEITLPSVGALTLQGSGGVDFIRGSPVPSGSGTYLFQTTSNKAIFVFSPGCSYSSIKDMSFSPSLVPASTPELTGKIGIRIDGDLPNVIWSLNFERLFFYNLEFGIGHLQSHIQNQTKRHLKNLHPLQIIVGQNLKHFF